MLTRPPACLPTACREHQAALKAGVAGGVLQLVGTDHAVFNSSQKAVGRGDFRLIPNGVNGLEVSGRWTACGGQLEPQLLLEVLRASSTLTVLLPFVTRQPLTRHPNHCRSACTWCGRSW